ncbi:polypeptide N-acetylgalactosaminyltransferase 13 [Tetranychus urticae]|uniref:Polypeptide N-acetylgalactosaminyltransferase n=1 Tax=Tetranychus urticae TaxID=32264 RepID=T1L225_TETUR|nr:polypeptide N-acetylgalactosaminyltransferase 13 [Tetranychus urticae]XP_015792881.1 polypeptide N-acetylgalactosaminyltransferase 13 [Tetranychus urticae]XP_015792882.1 polypeptide N-acetylgalactosaminyltransferase 13 [Tetranychus urticae]XP_015792883.1 polypeptide N-acetylgalactosaminyltransferase 13 [Tetranychus urticae]
MMSRVFRLVISRRRVCFKIFIILFVIVISSILYLFSRSTDQDLPDDNASDVVVMLSESKLQKEYINKKGIHVIVGQYNGKSLPWLGSANLSQEILNSNNYNPIPKAGENGSPVYVPQYEQQKVKILYHINKFNLVASDKISVKRSLPDPRKQRCRNKVYTNSLGKASIIIVFHNEAWSTLVRTVHSVISTSPRKILEEIILVDDASTRTFLGTELDSYMVNLTASSLVPIKILRSKERIGLIKARLIGAERATGKVLTFLDAHCEATIGWLEPLLDRISSDPTRVVCPVIDIIHEETFAFARSFELHWGGINWNLHFRWYPIGQAELSRIKKHGLSEVSHPFRTPIMAGGLFAIDRQYFYSIGSYDAQMDIWGGENIELSLRVWQCGGTMEIVPCSHVGHLFRKSSPYSFPRPDGVTGVLYTNLARVLHVWMDPEYLNFFYKINPVMKRTIFGEMSKVEDYSQIPSKLANLTERIELKKRLSCKSFSWFLENVWPEHFFPTHDRFFGKIRNVALGECLQRPNAEGGPSNNGVGRVDLEKCAIETYSPQCFVYTKQGIILTDESICLDAINVDTDPTVLLLACSQSTRQHWLYSLADKTIRHVRSNLCLDLGVVNRRRLTLNKCSSVKSQMWDMIAIDWHKP